MDNTKTNSYQNNNTNLRIYNYIKLDKQIRLENLFIDSKKQTSMLPITNYTR